MSLKPPDDRLSSHNLILGGWIALIFFSSTDIAASWANALYAVLSTGSGLDKGVSMFVFQKAYHVFLFGVLGCLIASANGSRRNPLPRVMLWSFLIGALSEALQFAFEGRGPSVADALLNGASGSAAGWLWTRWLAVSRKAASSVAES